MAFLTLTKRFTFEMAHLLPHYEGLCKNIHGHSYKLDVTISGEPNHEKGSHSEGMIMDFKEFKSIVNQSVIDIVDHSLVLNQQTDEVLINFMQKQNLKLFLIDYRPTTENFLLDFANKIQEQLPNDITLYQLRLQETEGSLAEWHNSAH